MILQHILNCKQDFIKENSKEPNTLFLGILTMEELLLELDSMLYFKGNEKCDSIVYGMKVIELDKLNHFQLERIKE
jgi:hypothetical protein